MTTEVLHTNLDTPLVDVKIKVLDSILFMFWVSPHSEMSDYPSSTHLPPAGTNLISLLFSWISSTGNLWKILNTLHDADLVFFLIDFHFLDVPFFHFTFAPQSGYRGKISLIKKNIFCSSKADHNQIMGCARISRSRDCLQNVPNLISTLTTIIIFLEILL